MRNKLNFCGTFFDTYLTTICCRTLCTDLYIMEFYSFCCVYYVYYMQFYPPSIQREAGWHSRGRRFYYDDHKAPAFSKLFLKSQRFLILLTFYCRGSGYQIMIERIRAEYSADQLFPHHYLPFLFLFNGLHGFVSLKRMEKRQLQTA